MGVSIDSTGDVFPGGAVCETAGGTKVAITTNGSSIKAWTGVDSSPSQIGSTQTATTIFGSAVALSGVHAAIDGNDVVHVVACDGTGGSTREISYATISDPDSSPSWSSWELVASYDQNPTATNIYRVSVSIDSSNIPHVLFLDTTKFMGTDYAQVYYTNRGGGSWSTPVEVSGQSDFSYFLTYSSLSLKASDNAEAIYSPGGTGDLYRNTRTSGSWGTESNLNLTETQTQIQYAGGMVIDSSGAIHYSSQDNANPYEVYGDNSDTGGRGYAQAGDRHMNGIGIDSSNTLYVFYIDITGRNLLLYSGSAGSWTSEGTLEDETGALNSVVVGWSWNNLNNTSSIDYLYSDNAAGVWYGAFTLSGDVTITVNQLTLAGSAVSVTVVPGAVSQLMDVLTLAGSATTTTVVAVTTLVMAQLTLAGAAIALTVVPGAASVTMTQVTLAGAAIAITVDAPVNDRVPKWVKIVQSNGSERLAVLHRS